MQECSRIRHMNPLMQKIGLLCYEKTVAGEGVEILETDYNIHTLPGNWLNK